MTGPRPTRDPFLDAAEQLEGAPADPFLAEAAKVAAPPAPHAVAPAPGGAPVYPDYGRGVIDIARGEGGNIGEVARAVGRVGKNLVRGMVDFTTAPVRAAFAPETPEEANNPLIQAAKLRAGASLPSVRADRGRAVARRAEGARRPDEIALETARSLPRMGFDAERGVQEVLGGGPTLGNLAQDALTGSRTADQVIEAEREDILRRRSLGEKVEGVGNLVALAGLYRSNFAHAGRHLDAGLCRRIIVSVEVAQQLVDLLQLTRPGFGAAAP